MFYTIRIRFSWTLKWFTKSGRLLKKKKKITYLGNFDVPAEQKKKKKEKKKRKTRKIPGT